MTDRQPPTSAVPDTLTLADRRLAIEIALDDHGAGVLQQAILDQPSRRAAIAFVRAVMAQGTVSGRTPAGEAYALHGTGQRAGLAVTVGDRSGIVRWSEIADTVRLRQLVLPF